MIKNGQNISQEISTQVCIVGSGAAGITLAWFLDQAGIKVTLIDGSRDFGPWPNNLQCGFNMPSQFFEDKKLLYNGESTGLFTTNYSDKGEGNFLILPTPEHCSNAWERERYFGGTTNHWGGQSRPLDPIVFEGYTGYLGWPITSTDLAPYYTKAAALCRLTDNFTASYWAQRLGDDVPNLPGFETEMYQFIGPNYKRFAQNKFNAQTETFGPNGQTLEDSKINVIRNASLLEIHHQNGTVNSLRVGSIDSTNRPATEFTIKADAYVLACGAVANAHQLLLSNAANSSGNVGHYFMCHPLINNAVHISGTYLTTAQANLMDGKEANGTQWRDDNGVTVTGRFIPTADKARALNIGRCWFWSRYSSFYFQQAANYKSCITLADTKDPVFQQRQTQINWEFCDLDENTYAKTTKLFKEAVAESSNKINGNGTVDFASWDYIKRNAVVNGHHLGTTRMSKQPQDGVVNGNLRTHDLDNLYVAGSSVWPSAGISNPTFTIITLAIRLADHLQGCLNG